uniref:Uncharacterized protein n=1 Tax=Lepeophtheirus salmonis TaxID=72036 RepID=A0A0K2TDP6_LEPSM
MYRVWRKISCVNLWISSSFNGSIIHFL